MVIKVISQFLSRSVNSKQFEEIYQIVYDANRSALHNGSKNNTGSELDQLARSHISSKNYGDYFTHRLGHGIGLEVHEEPYIVGNNNYNLKIGNCHTIEPGIYYQINSVSELKMMW